MIYLCVQTGVVTSPKHNFITRFQKSTVENVSEKDRKDLLCHPYYLHRTWKQRQYLSIGFQYSCPKDFNNPTSELNEWMLSEQMSWFLISIGYTHTRTQTNTQNKLTQ